MIRRLGFLFSLCFGPVSGNYTQYYTFHSGIGHPDAAHAACQQSGRQLAKVETSDDWNSLRSLIRTRSWSGNCVRIGAVKPGAPNGHWQWRDGSRAFPPGSSGIRENDGGTEACSCWWYANSIMYDAPCRDFGQGSQYACSPSPPAPPQVGKFAKLRDLKELLDGGVLTQEEFDDQKKQILQA